MKILYIAVVMLSCCHFFWNLFQWKSKKRSVDKTHYQWSTRFNPHIPRNRGYYLFLGIYLIVALYFFIALPHQTSDYTMPLFLLAVLSIIPRWNVAVGDSGIVLELRLIPKDSILKAEIISKRNNSALAIKFVDDKKGSGIKEKTIPCPFKKLDLPWNND